jgi:hypothetical protein
MCRVQSVGWRKETMPRKHSTPPLKEDLFVPRKRTLGATRDFPPKQMNDSKVKPPEPGAAIPRSR